MHIIAILFLFGAGIDIPRHVFDAPAPAICQNTAIRFTGDNDARCNAWEAIHRRDPRVWTGG